MTIRSRDFASKKKHVPSRDAEGNWSTFPNGDTSCWRAATLSPILSFFSCSITARKLQPMSQTTMEDCTRVWETNITRTFGDTGDVLGLVFLGFFEVMLPTNSSELVVTTAFPLK